MAAQRPDDLLWIRDDFWTSPTGLVNERGEGPIVIAGHTPTPYLTGMLGEACGPTRNAAGLAQMVKVEDVLRHGGAAGLVDVHAAEGALALVEGVGDHAAV